MGHHQHLRIALVLAAFAVCAPAASAAPRGALLLAENGAARAAIVVAKDADPQTREAADLLARTLQQSTGAAFPILVDGDVPADPAPAARLFVGRCPSVDTLDLPLKGLDDDGFLIRPAGADALAIVGPTAWGTEFGVCEFLERYVGVRWLLPGPDGTDVPQHQRLAVPRGEIRKEPVFFSRQFSGLRGAAQGEWARRNRMHARVGFHHNLIHLFPPEKYTKTHPEFFPERGGKRFLPADSSVHGWQPCFTAPGLVEEAVKNINAALDANPKEKSYSLGVNDSSGHCDCQRCRERDPGGNNFLKVRDVSDRYFEWANQVVEGVLKTHPDVFFGCLAYSEVAAPPTRVKVHPRIIPYMTYDRMKWADPEIRAEGEEMTRRWHASSPTVGWYDYIYGSPYCLPRVYFHRMGESYRFARANGVKVHYAEAYPNWGEGPKLYVSLRLQWDPDQNVDALLKEWYERCAGRSGARALAAYFAQWEEFWTGPALKARWFSRGGQYLNFSSPLYLSEVPAEAMHKSRRLLETALAEAETEPQKARVRLLLRAFEYYEASALSYPGAPGQSTAPPADEAAALAAGEGGQQRVAMAEKRIGLAAEFEKDPVLTLPLGLDRFPQLSGRDWGGSGIWRAFDWVAKGDGPVRQRVAQLAADPKPSLLRDQARMLLALADPKSAPVNANPSFEEGAASAPPWNSWVKGAGKMQRVEGTARSGKASLLCKGVDRGGPNQSLPVTPGRYGAVAFVYMPPGTETKGTVQLAITFRDAQNNNLPTSPSATILPRAGKWSVVAVPAVIPAKVGEKEVKSVLLVPIVDGFAEGDELYIDDVALYRLDD